jgi:hypothetical protein
MALSVSSDAFVDQFATADPADRARLYQQLGIDLLYQPTERLVLASADLRWHIEGVGGSNSTICLRKVITTLLP